MLALLAPTAVVSESSNPVAAPNAIFVEGFGNGLLYSLNYERILTIADWNFGFRLGGSYFATKISSASGSGLLQLASIPMVVSWYAGLPHHKLQIGLGATVLWVSASTDSTGAKYEGAAEGVGLAATAVVGYRYMPEHTGFTFGFGFTPLLRATKGFLPWPGASAGIAF